MYDVLFLCTGNSARSIMAEALLNRWGQGHFRGFSAGSQPAGYVHPYTLGLLQKHHLLTAGLRSKSWDEFAQPDAPQFDFVFTVCDRAAAESCPVWPGQPVTAHWGLEDPAAVHGYAQRQRAFVKAFHTLEARIKLLVSLPIAQLEGIKLKQRLDEIGRT